MKIKTAAFIVFSTVCLSQSQIYAQSAFSAGARYHQAHSQYIELPFDKGDLSYTLGYEYHEGAGFWQLLVGYAPSIGNGIDGRGFGVDAVITPQLNLLFSDRNWLAGAGALASYIKTETENDWTDVYWQVMIGYEIPLPAFKLEIMAYYPFEKWSTFRDFKAKDIDFGAFIKHMF